MQRSRKRKLRRAGSLLAKAPLASSILVALAPAYAQETAAPSQLEEIIVTAQKRSESLQDVPLSIQAFGATKLEELHVASFADYAKFMPSLSYQNGGQAGGPGFQKAYMRGVASGGDGNHSGSRPSVGTYLDEQPVTTIGGALDINVYDVERVEVLAGPQGTLYGASSQSGTIRIITNKPDPSGFKAGYDLEVNTINKGGTGYVAQGYANVPMSETTAVRLVGWTRHEAGYIDNVHGTRTYVGYPGYPDEFSGITIDNAARVKKDYNDVDTTGARAALKVDLDDSWAITAAVMGQDQQVKGAYGYNTASDLAVQRFNPEWSKDRWWQAALTIEGKLGNFDVVYAGSYLDRKLNTQQDYVDYSLAYDAYSYYVINDAGQYTDPTQYFLGDSKYKIQSHELRVSYVADGPFKFVAGLFYQRQQHDILQRYMINDIAGPPPGETQGAPSLEVTGWPDTWWLTNQVRVDSDYAAFGEATYDITEQLSITGGIRFFKARNSLVGFFGFGLTNPNSTGEKWFPETGRGCNPAWPSPSVNGGPCTNLDTKVENTGHTPKVNLRYRFDDQHLVYATYSEGFRPGGANRRDIYPPYDADYLKNYELGWKTTWADGRLRFNGALFVEDWNNAQFSFLGLNSLTVVLNAGSARIKGAEADLLWAASDRLTLSAGFAVLDAKLTSNFCQELDENGRPVTDCEDPAAPSGTQLPVTPKFKGNVTARYNFNVGSYDTHLQAAVAYVGSRWPDLRTLQRNILGREKAYTLVDLAAGIEKGSYTAELFINNAFDERAQLDRWAQCDAATCGVNGTYITTTTPRTIGLRFGQKF